MRLCAFLLLLCLGGGRPASGIVLYRTDDPTANTSTPGDNSGWQYEGNFNGFPGTPIAPFYFLAAHHIGGSVGDVIVFHGQSFPTTAFYDDVTAGATPTEITDLRIWKVSTPFPTYAPMYKTGTETGLELRVFGRGAQRGDPVTVGNVLKGWNWGNAGYVQRWGTNTVAALPNSGQYLQATFSRNGGPNEAHFSAGDSSGGVFVQEGGLWKLAAINYGVDILYDAAGNGFSAAIFDARGFYTKSGSTVTAVPDNGSDVPTSFYSTRVAKRWNWIAGIIGGTPAVLPPESYATWLHNYYTPDEIADPAVSAPGADPDQDGVSNLLEFAFNLDPTFPEPVVLTPASGVRGLPSIRLENAGGSQRLTVEYVRRTAASGSGVTYAAQFAGDLAAGDWATNTAETVTAINARWERVKVADPVAAGAAPARFARVQVTPDAQGAAGTK